MAVRPATRMLKVRECAEALSLQARTALALSAELSGDTLELLAKGDRGAPLPSGGVYWSLSHTSDFVAAVTAPYPIGIDIEKIKSFTPALRERVAGTREWELSDTVDDILFCRYWTAKEAVLKAIGIGLGGLKRCRITKICDDKHIQLFYDKEKWIVSHSAIALHHMAAITAAAGSVKWHCRKAGN